MAEFMFHEFRLDVAGAQLWRGVDRIALPPKPFAVLRLLVERAGELVTKDHLLDAVWSRRHVSESSLSVSINALRAALGDDPKAPRCIETVNRLGYRFIAPLAKAPQTTGKDGAAAALFRGETPIGLPPKLRCRPRHGLFGRMREQSRMMLSWDAAQRGERRLVMIAGEPGIGKTRLALETARQAHGDGAVVLLGSCDADIGLPYRPFVEALQHYVKEVTDEVLAGDLRGRGCDLARLIPELTSRVPGLREPAAADTETERYLMFEAVAELLAAMSKRHPVMLVLDDLQWARAADLLLLKHIVRSAMPMRVMIVVAYRDDGLAPTHPLLPLLADFRHETGIERIALQGLDEEGIVALAADAAGHPLDPAELMLARAIHRDTEGNPFFAAEILRNLQETGAAFGAADYSAAPGAAPVLCLPESVKEVLGRRLSRLSPKTQRLLGIASAIGREFDVPLLAKIAGQSDDEVLDGLDEARGAALVVEVSGAVDRFAFAHALTHATLYDAMSAARRARMHRRIGEGLEALTRDRPGERLDELARHWLAAARLGDPAKAVAYAQRAAQRALSGLAFEEAAKYHEQALQALDRDDRAGGPLRCDLLIALGDAQRRAGNLAYRATAAQAVTLAKSADDPPRLARAALGNAGLNGIFLSTSAADQDLIALYEAALAKLGGEDSTLRSELLAQLAVELILTPERERRHALSREAVAIARRIGDRTALIGALNARIFAIMDPTTLAERLSLAAELESLVEENGGLALRWSAAFHHVRPLLELGDIDGVARALDRMGALAAELRQPYFNWWGGVARAMLSALRGASDAEQQALAAGEIGFAAGQPDAALVFSGQLAEIRHSQGRTDELAPAMRAMVDAHPHLPAVRAVLAYFYSEMDRIDAARAELAPIGATGFRLPLDWLWAMGMGGLALVCAAIGDRAAAAVLYPQIQPFADQVGVGGIFAHCIGSMAYPCGRLAACLELWDEAEQHFEEALAMNQRIGARPYHIRTRRALAAMLLRRRRPGDAARASELIGSATVDAAELGMRRETTCLDLRRGRLHAAAGG